MYVNNTYTWVPIGIYLHAYHTFFISQKIELFLGLTYSLSIVPFEFSSLFNEVSLLLHKLPLMLLLR